ncbi:sensor histidine kinase [Oerskovia merdavium]|uniref:histidine kinase n=1 Tax=Oerskovia merdavium TaxID=2762227 RepID=A0ABR8U4C0_9CELL|nr:histidine kinase [Oerskovia merdavium]MBD7982886.1 hypothetical protein [Oerskovia merdavium]
MTALTAPLPVRLGHRLSALVRRTMPSVARRERAIGLVLALGVLALVVSELARNPVVNPYDPSLEIYSWSPSWVTPLHDAAPWLTEAYVPVVLAGHASAVAAVVLARFRPIIATVLAALPFVAIPLYGTFYFGWWWALAGVAVLAGFTRVRDAVPAYLLAIGVIGLWNATLVMTVLGFGLQVTATGGPMGWWTVLGYAAYLAAAVAVAAALGSGLRYGARSAAAQVAERRAVMAESVTAERARLARDLHDVVAHHVSLIAVRAESTRFSRTDLDDELRNVLTATGDDARSALAELRQILSVLQRSDTHALTPQPGADDVTHLVDEARAAGQQVELSGTWEAVPAGTGYALYRAVQEGLSNARRHAPHAPVKVLLEQRADVISVRMTNPTDKVDFRLGPGLTGMRERIEALGGDLHVSIEDGLFFAVVCIPVAEA